MPETGSVWLVGMMGAGKSVVGQALAARLGLRFVDADAEVERRAGASIAQIFAREGEAGFRARERETIDSLLGAPGVVALGGGALDPTGVPDLLKRNGTIVYLRARAETLLERVGEASERPLLAGLEREERLRRIRALLAARCPHYAQARYTVDTDGKAVDAVAAEVAGLLAMNA